MWLPLSVLATQQLKKQFIPELQQCVPFRVAASAFASILVAHRRYEPALERSQLTRAMAQVQLRTSELHVVRMWLTSVGRTRVSSVSTGNETRTYVRILPVLAST